MSKLPKTPEEWAKWRSEVAAEQEKASSRMDYDETKSAYADPEGWDQKGHRNYRNMTVEELRDEWEILRRHAIVTFPEGKAHGDLPGPHKLTAIALCIGWTIPKIAAASKISETSVRRILKDPKVIAFMKEYQIRQGDGDPRELLNSLAYQAVKFAGSLLNDPDTSESMKRLKLDAGKWITERCWGKPNQPIEHKGVDMAKVFKHLASNPIQLSDEDEDDLFRR